jgi:hypothetical protein
MRSMVEGACASEELGALAHPANASSAPSGSLRSPPPPQAGEEPLTGIASAFPLPASGERDRARGGVTFSRAYRGLFNPGATFT